MEGIRQLPIPGFRQTSLKKSFKLGLLPLLTTCSREEIAKAFGRFTDAEQDALHRLLIQVIPSLHQNIEDEFESQCLETQAGTVLDTVEELVEEQNLDSLSQYSNKTEVADAWRNLSIAKRNEIHYLTRLIKTAEEHKRVTRAHVEQLKKEMQDSSAADVIEKGPKSTFLNPLHREVKVIISLYLLVQLTKFIIVTTFDAVNGFCL